MRKILVLDCTLRDGGYINDFNFGQKVIKDIILSLSKANIDVIECGFLRDGINDKNLSLFNNVKYIENLIPSSSNSLFVAMVQLGKFDLNNLPQCDPRSIKGIRLSFHKHEINEAITAGRIIKEKGYKLFFQPVGTTTYSDKEIIELVKKVNTLKPSVLYVVDTLGVMQKNDVFHFFKLIDKHMDKNIQMGFHSHNNLQLSFSNAQSLLNLEIDRDIYIDSSLNGMGRGAGNLCTELICSFLNKEIKSIYDTNLLIQLIDNYIFPLKNKYQWGYSIAYYLSAISNCHPNYATFLLNKKTLTIGDIGSILKSIPKDKRELFNESLIKELYFNYLDSFNNQIVFDKTLDVLKRVFKNKDVLVIAPGKNATLEAKKIQSFIKSNNCLILGINEENKLFKFDYLFISNKKKLKMIDSTDSRLILTSNLFEEEYKNQIFVDYESLQLSNDDIKDNAGLMSLKLLDSLNVKNIYLAGFDGFTSDDFAYMYTDVANNALFAERINLGIKEFIKTFNTNIIFITKSLYE